VAAHQLVIAAPARIDLKDIYQYGLRQWAQGKSDIYLETLKNQLWSLIEQLNMGIERAELVPGMRSLPIESHILFYRVTANRVEIIRVLHGRQDPGRHLK
jgi:toxin ParE1/3/4